MRALRHEEGRAVPRDPVEGIRWFERAARQGAGRAPEQAWKWLTDAVSGGHAAALEWPGGCRTPR